ncbi:hypothetical protein [Anaerococcus sp. Marseille-P9784]|uniref:hypothetical protein n=1 Tax=Anaerococcus sp. Marseille-P9784 TaxID=2614127 RepID=UPI00124A65CF|nr:hypothetical protein [Anaerococcus sp. Marseille-P9784]
MNEFKYYLSRYSKVFFYLGVLLILASLIYRWADIRAFIDGLISFIWRIFMNITLFIVILASIWGIIKSIFRR